MNDEEGAVSGVAQILEAGRALALELRDSTKLAGPRALPHFIEQTVDGEKIHFVQPAFSASRRPGPLKAVVHDLQSLLHYIAEHSGPSSRLYAEYGKPIKFTLVVDDQQGAEIFAFRDHRCSFAPALSTEWDTWVSKSGKDFGGNAEFALFLEDNLPDILEPTADAFMGMITTFRVEAARAWSNDINLNNGQVNLVYKNIVDGTYGEGRDAGGGKLNIPEKFKIRIPVFQSMTDAPLYEIDARFRWRLDGNTKAVKMRYELVRPHKVQERAFLDLLATLGDAMTPERPIYNGSPDK